MSTKVFRIADNAVIVLRPDEQIIAVLARQDDRSWWRDWRGRRHLKEGAFPYDIEVETTHRKFIYGYTDEDERDDDLVRLTNDVEDAYSAEVVE